VHVHRNTIVKLIAVAAAVTLAVRVGAAEPGNSYRVQNLVSDGSIATPNRVRFIGGSRQLFAGPRDSVHVLAYPRDVRSCIDAEALRSDQVARVALHLDAVRNRCAVRTRPPLSGSAGLPRRVRYQSQPEDTGAGRRNHRHVGIDGHQSVPRADAHHRTFAARSDRTRRRVEVDVVGAIRTRRVLQQDGVARRDSTRVGEQNDRRARNHVAEARFSDGRSVHGGRPERQLHVLGSGVVAAVARRLCIDEALA